MRFWVSLIFLLASVWYTSYAFLTLDFHTPDGQPGSGFFPIIIGIGLIVFTLINVILELKEKSKEDNVITINYGKEIIWTIVALVIFAATLRPLGGLIAMILFVFIILFGFNKKRVLQNILISLIFPILVSELFKLLNAGLPKGIFGF